MPPDHHARLIVGRDGRTCGTLSSPNPIVRPGGRPTSLRSRSRPAVSSIPNGENRALAAAYPGQQPKRYHDSAASSCGFVVATARQIHPWQQHLGHYTPSAEGSQSSQPSQPTVACPDPSGSSPRAHEPSREYLSYSDEAGSRVPLLQDVGYGGGGEIEESMESDDDATLVEEDIAWSTGSPTSAAVEKLDQCSYHQGNLMMVPLISLKDWMS